jgi:hypothetical protein
MANNNCLREITLNGVIEGQSWTDLIVNMKKLDAFKLIGHQMVYH